ncbi:uncharacterized protein A1O5_09349 [Cladophialophora psammophila CBS 110553]|uniref:Sodium/calcium exchanger membrane region domain-containing protein n=1 Tax=Cladophialophora psammophila CBS 110553 TaxID=1182543 RepID=W9WRS6_9EURO|nr:uncharacterized protein A1O5_09349 [Cladophialophora psammophila CBS 110553]EXJ67336.1 hypothetical protein A1O5_09349 [Cladophialophora psammophila CBS 110553]
MAFSTSAPAGKHEAEEDLIIINIHRNAHRVFLRRSRTVDLFNPSRHIPWKYEYLRKHEATSQELSTSEYRGEPQIFAVRIGNFHIYDHKYQWSVPKQRFTFSSQIKRTLFTSRINVLLVCIPIGQCLRVVRGQSASTFTFNFVAAVPLWFLCDYALEEIEKYIARTLSDIVDIFTTNTAQVISSYLLLKAGKVALLQASLVGSILSNILSLLGLSTFVGGLRHHPQKFNRTGAQGASDLLSIVATSVLIPTAAKHLKQTTQQNLVLQSHGVALVLLFIDLSYAICQMWTHRKGYNERVNEDQPTPRRACVNPSFRPRSTASGRSLKRDIEHNARGTSAVDQGTDEPGLPEEDVSQDNTLEVTGVHLRFDVAILVLAMTIGALFPISAWRLMGFKSSVSSPRFCS